MVNMSHQGVTNQLHIRDLYQISHVPRPICQDQFTGVYKRMGPFALKPGLIKHSDMIMSQVQPRRQNLLGLWHAHLEPTFDGKKTLHNSSKSFYLKNKNNFLKPVCAKLNRSNRKRRSWRGEKLVDKSQSKGISKIEKIVPKPYTINGTIKGEGYGLPSLPKFQYQNRFRPHKINSKREFRKMYAPPAPRNTSSLIMQAKNAGGVASHVSPSFVSPLTLVSAPKLSPSSELLGDLAMDDLGVECYGSMQGLIRFRPEEMNEDAYEEEEEKNETDGNGSKNSIVEEHLKIERRLDHDLSRFEMVNLNYEVGNRSLLANRVDDQNIYIGELEDENFALREKMFLMKRELGDVRRKLQFLEGRQTSVEDVDDEILDCCSDNEMV